MNYLTNNQRIAIDKFKELRVGALFMEMGTGKTRTALELCEHNHNNYSKVLWFTPFSTKENLKKEISKWNYNIDIEIIGYETLQSSDKKYLELLKYRDTFIVCDESIFIKNGNTIRHKRLMELAKESRYRLLLNGTPITKNEWDLYYQMEFLSPKIFNMSENEFLQTFYRKVDFKKRGQKPRTFYELSEVNIEYLYKLIEPYTINVKFGFDKNEIEKTLFVSANEKTILEYEEVKNNALEELYKYNSETIINLLTRLNVLSSNDLNKAKEISKFIKDKQIIVFCSFLQEIKNIESQMECDYYTITGSIKQNERNKIIEQFKMNKKPLLITLGTGAFGLNLQFCNKIVFSSLSMDYAKVLQAKARIRRIGQNKDIEYYHFDLDLPINRFISNNLDKKKELEKLLLEELKNGKVI